MPLSFFLFGDAVTKRGPVRNVFNAFPSFQRVSDARCVAEADQRLRESRFDVAVVDLDADGGPEVLQKIRKDTRHCHIPVVGLSWECQGPRVEHLLTGGLDSVVIKPVEPKALQGELDYIVGPATGKVRR